MSIYPGNGGTQRTNKRMHTLLVQLASLPFRLVLAYAELRGGRWL